MPFSIITPAKAGPFSSPAYSQAIRSLLTGAIWLILAPSSVGLAASAIDLDHPSASRAVTLDSNQIATGNFGVLQVQSGRLERHIKSVGTIVPSGDRIARVAVRLLGTVAQLNKRLGESVEAGDIVAVIESREIADAKSDYLAAKQNLELQQTLHARNDSLYQRGVISGNENLKSRNFFADLQVRFESAKQKLLALNLTPAQIKALPITPPEFLRQQELRAPIKGIIAERRVEIGSLVGREGQESELFVIVDTRVLWVELSVALSALEHLALGRKISITSNDDDAPSPATILFISPLVDRDTRQARVIAEIDNADGRWRPGTFVSASIPMPSNRAEITIPKSAIQTLAGEPVVFVQTDYGFSARTIKTGLQDAQTVEVSAGLRAGEQIATQNTFTLKAELGKAQAQH